jgi:hypothetical protein
MDSLKFYVVVSYKSDALSSFPDVVINGMYPDLKSSIDRQLEICGGQHKPSGAGNNSVYGVNGVVSWIKQVSVGDLENWNVRSPDKVIYQENKNVVAKSTV